MYGIKLLSVVFVAAAFLGGCAYKTSAPVSPSYNVYSNYEDKVPGRFALYVNASSMRGEFKVDGLACSAHTYPMDASSAFKTSTLRTLANLVEDIEVVPTPLSRDRLKSGEYDGQIIVELEDMDVRLRMIPGFWTSEMEADVELTASIRVDGREGRVLGTTVSSDEHAKAEAGGACEGGANAISDATSDALEELMQKLGERFANSERVRALGS